MCVNGHMTYSKAPNQNFLAFITWAGDQSKAATHLDVSESTVSLIASGKRPVSKKVAERAEIASLGKFKKESMFFDHEVMG